MPIASKAISNILQRAKKKEIHQISEHMSKLVSFYFKNNQLTNYTLQVD